MIHRPPGPTHLLGLTFIQRFKTDPLKLLMGLHQEYGDTVFARMGPYRAFFFFHPESVREILVQKVKVLPKWRTQVKILRQWDGNGLLLSEGDFWARQRKLVQPAFHTKRFVRYAEIMVEHALGLATSWKTMAKETVIDVETAMTGLTLEIIARALFDAEVTGETSELGRAVAILSETAVREMGEVIHYPDWVPFPRVRQRVWATAYLDSTLRRVIAERRKSREDRGDLLSMLLHAVDSEGMTEEQARDEAMVLFLAGHDTTASGLVWLWYVMGRHPEIQRRVQEELDGTLQTRTPTLADVSKLSYLTCVLKEILRLYPPAVGVFAREAREDLELAGYHVPEGSIVYAFSYVTHRDGRWFPEPERFDPLRFLAEHEKQIPPFAYFPFGAGPRACIGAQFAMTEMTLIAASLLQRFDFSLAPDQGVPGFSTLLSLRPKGGLRMSVHGRTAGTAMLVQEAIV